MSEQQEPKTFEEDGTRPIKSGEIEVADTFEEDGTRPIAKGPDYLVQNQKTQTDSKEQQSSANEENARTQDDERVFEEDGIRPIKSGEMEVADTFEEDGTRPIAKGPDYLVQNQKTQTDSKERQSSTDNDSSQASEGLEIDGSRPIDDSDVEVVDTFEEDGTRPIMANEYEVVDTIKTDGERPITSE